MSHFEQVAGHRFLLEDSLRLGFHHFRSSECKCMDLHFAPTAFGSFSKQLSPSLTTFSEAKSERRSWLRFRRDFLHLPRMDLSPSSSWHLYFLLWAVERRATLWFPPSSSCASYLLSSFHILEDMCKWRLERLFNRVVISADFCHTPEGCLGLRSTFSSFSKQLSPSLTTFSEAKSERRSVASFSAGFSASASYGSFSEQLMASLTSFSEAKLCNSLVSS